MEPSASTVVCWITLSAPKPYLKAKSDFDFSLSLIKFTVMEKSSLLQFALFLFFSGSRPREGIDLSP
jgi:hypothetical protein